jgi:hypothetical protein
MTLLLFACSRDSDLLRSDGTLNVNITPHTIAELYSRCSDSDQCGRRRTCEGGQIILRGFVDSSSVVSRRFDSDSVPEKFRLFDHHGDSIEIRPILEDKTEIFQKIGVFGVQTPLEVVIRGRIQGFDMPIMGGCRRGIRIVIEHADDLVLVYGGI